MNTRLRRLMLALICLTVILSAAFATPAKGQQPARRYALVLEGLNLRTMPSTEGNVPIKVLKPGVLLRYEDLGNGWGRVIQDYDLETRIKRHTTNPVPTASRDLYFFLQYTKEITAGDLSPIPLQPGEVRWIEVDLSEQKLWAYSRINGKTTLYVETLVSSGLTYPTPTSGPAGFSIYSKRLSQSMVGEEFFPEEPEKDPFWIVEFIPAVQYIIGGVAIHGTYWHDQFGTPMSHGCINVPVDIALKLFLWTTPHYDPFAIEHYNARPGEGTKVYIRQ